MHLETKGTTITYSHSEEKPLKDRNQKDWKIMDRKYSGEAGLK